MPPIKCKIHGYKFSKILETAAHRWWAVKKQNLISRTSKMAIFCHSKSTN